MDEGSSNKQKGWKSFRSLKIQKGSFKRRARKIETATLKHAHRFLVRRWTNVKDVGRFTTGWLVLVGLLIGLATLQAVWFADAYTTQAPADGGTYAEGMVSRLETMNPLFASTVAEVSASKLIFSSLLSYDEYNKLRPDVASKMSISEDGKIYTIVLKDNVYWHDGTKLTADDILFTVALMQNPAVNAVQKGSWVGVKAEKISDKQVQFTLPAVYAPFAQALTFGILPKHILKDVEPVHLRENGFGRKPVGTGPFAFRQLQLIDPNKDRLVVHMEANENYYHGNVKLNRFQIHTYENRETLKRALITSEVNSALGLGSDQLAEIDAREGFAAAKNKLHDGMFAIYNNDSPVFKELKMRQAFLQATNRLAIIEKIKNRGINLEGPLPHSFLPDNIAKQLPFDEKVAATLLDEAGWVMVGQERQKEGQKLEVTLVAPDSGDYKLLLEEIAAQWRKLGIGVKAQLADPSNIMADYIQSRSYDVLIYELEIGADADVYHYWHSSQAGSRLNLANYRSGVSDDALSSARVRLDPALRTAKYKTFYDQWIKDTPAIALYQPLLSYITGVNSTSLNFEDSVADIATRYRNVERWAVSKNPVMTTR